MLPVSKESGKSPNSESTLKKSDFVTREPISIFSRIKNADEEEKNKLDQLLETLRKNLPEGFKIGAAVGEGDCFFDSVAQGLSKLKKGKVELNSQSNAKLLRGYCMQHARESSNLKKALEEEGKRIEDYIAHVGFTVEDTKNADPDTIQSKDIIYGRPDIEGKIISKKYNIRIKTIKLNNEQTGESNLTESKIGRGDNIIYVLEYLSHYVPLLSDIERI